MSQISEKNEINTKKAKRNNDVTAKILCLVGAILLWFYVISSQTIIDERRFASIPVEIVSSDTLESEYGMTVISGYNYSVDITVSGVRNEINKIHAEDISAYVDLSQIIDSGEYSLEVHTSLPSGITVKELSTDYVNVYVDKRASRNIELRIDPRYTIESEYSLGTPSANIEAVSVTGPADVLAEIEYAQVTLELGRLTKSITATGEIALIGADGAQINNPYVKLSEKDVIVRVPVYSEKEVLLSVGFKHGLYTAKNSVIDIKPAKIKIKGDPTELSKITTLEVMTIDEKKMTGITGTRVAAIELPDGIENVDRIETATVTVTHINTATRDINVQKLNIVNPNNLKYKQLQESINVTLRGSSGSLSLVTSENISLEVDLKYYSEGAGKITVPISVKLPSGLSSSVYEIGEYSMEFEIE